VHSHKHEYEYESRFRFTSKYFAKKPTILSKANAAADAAATVVVT